MAIEVKIIIPSHKRAGRVSTHEIVSNAALCVPESQYDEYVAAYPGHEIIAHSDEVVGLYPKRQWIYDNFPNVCMLDDDLVECCRNYTNKRTVLTPDEVHDLIQGTANIAQMAGCYLAGWSKNPVPMYYDAQQPIRLSGFVTGCAHIMLEGSKLFYPPEIVLGGDFWISALNAYYHRKCFIDERFSFIQVDTFHSRGGLSQFRSLEAEKKATLFLRESFGDVIQPKREGFQVREVKGKVTHMKNKNPYGRSLILPF